MEHARGRTPWHLWLVAIVAILFNAIGVFDFVMSMAKGRAYMESAGMTPAQIEHYRSMPGWMTIAWAAGVFAAFAASILLLMRRRAAAAMFVFSLAAFAINLVYTYLLTDGGTVMGQAMAITSAVIAVLLFCFAAYARAMTRRGVLR